MRCVHGDGKRVEIGQETDPSMGFGGHLGVPGIRPGRLAIELDGPGHDRERTQQEDAIKERAWRAAGCPTGSLRSGDRTGPRTRLDQARSMRRTQPVKLIEPSTTAYICGARSLLYPPSATAGSSTFRSTVRSVLTRGARAGAA